MSTVPDFQSMLSKGVTWKEREAQLRYETDEDGNLLTDPTGAKTPRGSFALRKYITDINGPVGLTPRVVLDWSPKQLIDEILKVEKEKGLLLTPQEKREREEAEGPASTKENSMAKVTSGTKRVNLRRGSAGAAPAKARTAAAAPAAKAPAAKASAAKGGVRTGGAVSRRPATVRATKPVQPDPEPPEATEPEGEVIETTEETMVMADVDYDALAAKVVEVLEPVLDEKIEAMKSQIFEEIGAAVGNGAAETLNHINILHDLFCSYLQVDNTVLDKEDLPNGIVDLVDGGVEEEPEGEPEGN